jgi:hypothetical protein
MLRALLATEAQDDRARKLTDEQLAEVRRRRAQTDPVGTSAGQVFKRFQEPGAWRSLFDVAVSDGLHRIWSHAV